MEYDLLIKCFIAFCVGGIIYKFISDRCSCGIVEGQNDTTQPPPPTTPPLLPADPALEPQVGAPETATLLPADPALESQAETPETVSIGLPINNITEFINTVNQNIFMSSIKETISNVIGALQSDKFSEENIPDYIDAVSSFEDFGNNTQALNYIELIVIEISNLDDNEFRDFINGLFNTADYCSTDKDLNAYIISMLLLEYYSIKIDNDLTQEYINISNRLSKYIPDIVEKVQKLNKSCEGRGKKVKSTIMDVMVHRLFKNNNTIINIGSLDSLVNELNKLDRVYGVVILLCITYIVVRFLGMFSMKVEV